MAAAVEPPALDARFDLLVLDFDGTLADSQAILVGLVNDVLEANDQPRADTNVVATAIGLPLEQVFQRALPGAAAATIAHLCVEYRRIADRPAFVRQFRLYPNVAATLQALRSTGIRLVIGTSKGRATTTDIIRHCRIDDMIDAVVGGDCVTNGKPHPEMVRHAQRLVGVTAERTLVVGDTSFDIEMGQAAGVATCAVTYGMHPAAALRQLRPDFVIDRFEELSHLVGCREGTA
ncbi:MAG TPA: HAD-IA family hydrolase [Candidatus Margulisiibacteriota bacterium]|nr:HAD-IA family hydrolase [Candidatus Margulisiibacteriota bacterium]